MRSLNARNERRLRDRRQTGEAQDRGLDRSRFRVMIAAHRPRYRARALRAADGPGWLVTALLNRQDPIGMLRQKLAHVLVISADQQTNRNVGYLRAVQPLRADGLRVVGLFESRDEADALGSQCDAHLVVPWRTADVREKLSEIAMAYGFAPAAHGEDELEGEDPNDARQELA